jgi:hypothetical protein
MAAFIVAQRAEHRVPHATSCRALGVSPAWFYKAANVEVTKSGLVQSPSRTHVPLRGLRALALEGS